jgi:predicted GNAT family N-acyltransferase
MKLADDGGRTLAAAATQPAGDRGGEVRAFVVRAARWDGDGAKLRHVRRAVFIDEQRVPEALEWDAADAVCEHVLAEDGAGNAIATGRLLADGHLGRIAVLAAWRGQGVGAAIFEHLVRIAESRGHRTLRLNAQTGAIGFYRRYGFVVCSEEFVEAGLSHRKMQRCV